MKFPLWLTVEIFLTDIALGRIGNCVACPIARALQRLGYQHFTVNDFAIEFANGAKYETSTAAREFIWRYDNAFHVHATTFTFRRTRLPHSVQIPAAGELEVARG